MHRLLLDLLNIAVDAGEGIALVIVGGIAVTTRRELKALKRHMAMRPDPTMPLRADAIIRHYAAQ